MTWLKNKKVPRAGHLVHALKGTWGKSPKTWPELDPEQVLGILKTDHPDATRVKPGASLPSAQEVCGNWDVSLRLTRVGVLRQVTPHSA